MTERLPFHFSLSCIGEGNGNPLQCSCLENPRDGGAWWTAVYGVTQSWTRLRRLSCSSSSSGRGNAQCSPNLLLPKLMATSPTSHAARWDHGTNSSQQNVNIHSCHLLFDHFQFALIHGPNIPDSNAILLFTALDLASITSHVHNWVFFLLWLHLFILSGLISPLISSGILGTYQHGEFIFSIFLLFSYSLWGSQGRNIAVSCQIDII